MKLNCAAFSLFIAASAVAAEPVSISLRPVARPDVNVQYILDQVAPQVIASQVRSAGMQRSLRPQARPVAVVQLAKQTRRERRKGAVCGDLDIQGEPISPIRSSTRGCGIDQPVKVRSVSGVKLSTPATLNCTTAKQLKSWVDRGLKPAVGNRGGGVTSMWVMASYACRTRNSRKGAKISEHGKGNAIDIGAFHLANGEKITVLKGWRQRRDGKILKKMHRSACGPFGTVLGPESDRFHQDHFHFDTARHRGGAYCR